LAAFLAPRPITSNPSNPYGEPAAGGGSGIGRETPIRLGSLSFHVIAVRELEDSQGAYLSYLNLLSELAYHLDRQADA
jgi:hypothetical protein